MADIKKIPKGWELKKLGDVAEITSSKRIFKDEYVSEGIPFYRTKEVKELSEGKSLSFDLFISQSKYDEIKKKFIIPKKGDVLLSAVGTIGITYIVKDTKPFYFKDGNLMWFRNLNNLDSKYLSLGLTNFIRYGKGANTSGSTYNALTIETVKNFNFPIPPLKIQQAIVSKVEELFSELDKGIEDLKLAQEQLKVYRQSVLKYAFEGRLTNDNSKDGELSDGWKQIKLNEIVKISTEKHSPDNEEELFYIGLEHIEKNTGKLTNSAGFESIKTLKNKFKKGDILYGKLRPNLNKVYLAQEDGVCSTDILVLKVSENCVAKYLYNIMLSVGFVNLMSENTSGVNLPRVSSKFILAYEISLPPLNEQYRIIKEIENRLSVVDKMQESITESLQKAEALRQSILKKAFSGELVNEVKIVEVPKIKNEYFNQLQLVALVINGFKNKKIDHGEMTLAKNLYLLDSIYKIPTGFKYDRWHLGPYPPALKKVVNNKEYFKRNENFIETTNDDKLRKYSNPLQDDVNSAIADLSSIFSKYKGAERSHKTELLATVCKVIEDIKSTDLALVRQSMEEWKIDLKTSKFKNKAEKFNETETEKCIGFIIERGWDKKLV